MCVVLGSVYVCPLFEIFVGLGVFYMKIYIKRLLQRTYSSHFLLLPFSVFFSSRYNAFGGELCVSATYYIRFSRFLSKFRTTYLDIVASL